MTTKVTTGIEAFDELTGGIQNGLNIVFGGPGQGKSLFLVDLACRLSNRGKSVVFFSTDPDFLENRLPEDILRVDNRNLEELEGALFIAMREIPQEDLVVIIDAATGLWAGDGLQFWPIMDFLKRMAEEKNFPTIVSFSMRHTSEEKELFTGRSIFVLPRGEHNLYEKPLKLEALRLLISVEDGGLRIKKVDGEAMEVLGDCSLEIEKDFSIKD